MCEPKPNKCGLSFPCNGLKDCVYGKPDESKEYCEDAVSNYYHKDTCRSVIANVNKVILYLKNVKFGKDNILNFIKDNYDG